MAYTIMLTERKRRRPMEKYTERIREFCRHYRVSADYILRLRNDPGILSGNRINRS